MMYPIDGLLLESYKPFNFDASFDQIDEECKRSDYCYAKKKSQNKEFLKNLNDICLEERVALGFTVILFWDHLHNNSNCVYIYLVNLTN